MNTDELKELYHTLYDNQRFIKNGVVNPQLKEKELTFLIDVIKVLITETK